MRPIRIEFGMRHRSRLRSTTVLGVKFIIVNLTPNRPRLIPYDLGVRLLEILVSFVPKCRCYLSMFQVENYCK